MNKDVDWLRDEINKLYPHHSDIYNHPDDITVLKVKLLNNVLELIDQLDEPEITYEDAVKTISEKFDMNEFDTGLYIEAVLNNDKYKILSQEWIDEHSYFSGTIEKPFVFVDELEDILVSKQEEPFGFVNVIVDEFNRSGYLVTDIEKLTGLTLDESRRDGRMKDTWSNQYIICPHCGYEHESNYDDIDIFFEEGNHRYECWECEKKFRVNTEVEYVYETEELEE